QNVEAIFYKTHRCLTDRHQRQVTFSLLRQSEERSRGRYTPDELSPAEFAHFTHRFVEGGIEMNHFEILRKRGAQQNFGCNGWADVRWRQFSKENDTRFIHRREFV